MPNEIFHNLGFLAMIAALGGVIVAIRPAHAQGQTCNHHDVIVERLADNWGEGLVSIALAANGPVIETFANLATGTWTMTMTPPGGLTCLVGAGTDFQLTTTPSGEES
jgi:hypothetical protein